MKLELLKSHLQDIPHMRLPQAEEITRIILDNHYHDILELGFCHGVSTCYMAGALEELGQGQITTIDLESAKNFEPAIETLLHDLNLSSWVNVCYEPTSYTWRLMHMLQQNPIPQFDFCYIDGAHNWFVDGFAFFLVDRLLKPGGLIVFDDLNWTYDTSPSLKKTDFVKNMPDDERCTPQVRKVYELLVKTHPNYDEFLDKDGWAYARKLNQNEFDQISTVR
ncbi:MAG: class I SAM-dependent methyltransferase, partial [Gammaproteobacteria bacterium]|nr:class I SAM-dependent methyltransferase [Gammaproteobacteria bacterium]